MFISPAPKTNAAAKVRGFMDSRTAGRRAVAPQVVATAGLFLLAACGPEQKPGEACDLGKGDLVISELMPDAVGEEPDGEWLELYNATSKEVGLDRMTLELKGASGDRVSSHQVVGAGSLVSHGYFVIGAKKGSHVDYAHGNDVEMSNGGGVVALVCNGAKVDEVTYGARGGAPDPSEGRSLTFDGGLAPDAFLNDGGDYWCDAPLGTEPYDGTSRGSPGSRNEGCGLAMCDDGGVSRDVIGPEAGDLVVTELFADAAGADSGKEWLEVYVAASTAVDLNALDIDVQNLSTGATADYRLLSSRCVTGLPGRYLVLGASDVPTVNGNVEVDAVVDGLTFSNGVPLRITLRRGGTIIDVADLPGSSEGKSVRLDGSALLASQNDTTVAYCAASASQSGSFDALGTPGAQNGLCGTVSCLDGSSARAVVRPVAGDLVVSEVFAEPSLSGGGRDWLEVYVAASHAVDLNGLTLRNVKQNPAGTQSVSVASESCVRGNPGAYLVIAASSDSTANGGLTPAVAVTGLSFYNDVALTVSLLMGEVLIDSAEVPASVAGRSQSVQPASLSVSGNDLPANYCASSTSGIFAEKGTPGQANACGSTCLDGGVSRALVPPAANEVVLTELYANPTGTDSGRDWVEVYNASGRAIDLNGVAVVNTNPTPSTKTWTLESANCLELPVGGFAVIAGTRASTNGVLALATIGTDSDALFYSSFTGSSSVQLELGTTVLDVMTYTTQCSPSGKSCALDKDVLSAAANDAAASWCPAGAAANGFTDGSGSPGVANADCP